MLGKETFSGIILIPLILSGKKEEKNELVSKIHLKDGNEPPID